MRKEHLKKVTAVIMSLVIAMAMKVSVFADTIPVIDMGTFHNVYIQPTDEWIETGWDKEIKKIDGKDYILLKKYTGNERDLVIYGKATYEGKEYPVLVGLEYNSTTHSYKSFLRGNGIVRTIRFESVSGVSVMPEIPGRANEMFEEMTALHRVDFNNSFGGKLTDISDMFMACSQLETADLSGLDLSECTKAERVFKFCGSVSSTNLSGVNFGKLTDASEMFCRCPELKTADLSGATWGSSLTETDSMFFNDDALAEVTIPAGFTAGTNNKDMFKTTEQKKLLIKGSPSNTFISRVCPSLESSNRYIGEIGIKASVTLSGDILKADMFTCKLYKDSETDENLVKTVKNDGAGLFDFGTYKISDISKTAKYIAVQEAVEGVINNSGKLTKETTITLNSDGSLKITE